MRTYITQLTAIIGLAAAFVGLETPHPVDAAEELGIPPDHIFPDLSGLLEFVLGGLPARPR